MDHRRYAELRIKRAFMTASRTTAVIRRCGLAAAVVFALALLPGRAAASCGDHVLILKGQTVEQPAKLDTAHRSPTVPCDGPHCSGSPARESPPLSPVTTTGSSGKETAGVAGAHDTCADPAAPFERDSTSPRPVRRASSVFHPPRLG
jgi:hypothetical protein